NTSTMVENKLILCPIDFSEFAARAYHHALSLAEHYRARLVVQHVVDLWRYPSAGFAGSVELYDDFCRSLCETGKKKLQEFVKDTGHDRIQPELAVQSGSDASESVLSFAQEQKADVIVLVRTGWTGEFG